MRFSQVALLLVLSASSARLQAAANDVAPELLDYNLRTIVEAYDKAGRKNSKWDARAKACLKAFAEIRSVTNGTPTRLAVELRTNLPSVIALGCDDPM